MHETLQVLVNYYEALKFLFRVYPDNLSLSLYFVCYLICLLWSTLWQSPLQRCYLNKHMCEYTVSWNFNVYNIPYTQGKGWVCFKQTSSYKVSLEHMQNCLHMFWKATVVIVRLSVSESFKYCQTQRLLFSWRKSMVGRGFRCHSTIQHVLCLKHTNAFTQKSTQKVSDFNIWALSFLPTERRFVFFHIVTHCCGMFALVLQHIVYIYVCICMCAAEWNALSLFILRFSN